jgi:hypothetical protein
VAGAESSTQSGKELGALLVCGDTNASVDNLAAGAAKAGLSVVRVGNPAKVRRHCSLNASEHLAL